jgi:pyruvate/2-oxoglutarate dehydrogenase complex dihydrolipoamide dehydrogenase (E3) component
MLAMNGCAIKVDHRCLTSMRSVSAIGDLTGEPMLALRAMTPESLEGLVRVVARRDNHRIVGWQTAGAGVSELSTAFSHSLEMGATLEDVAGTIHAHRMLGEAVQEEAMRALGHALHI